MELRRWHGASAMTLPPLATAALGGGQEDDAICVAWTKNGDRLVGQIAKQQAVVNPKNTFFSMKRFIGRKMFEVEEEPKQVSYTVVRDGPVTAPSSLPKVAGKKNSLLIVNLGF
ncbi:hypothetical protein RJ639_044753 [Escallonia herrerae]|uniref:Uncharacterized protein n=1 Tax=Escallonia herrerae TaxID=1293975 RepID=A0AA88WBI7_9ASTE|nr:hypothetical protein RJ639_044753 [Escallonia herrerae]